MSNFGRLVCFLTLVVGSVGCEGFLTPRVARPPPGQDCARYEWVVRRPKMGASWGEPEFVGMKFFSGPGSGWAQFAQCPGAQPPDAKIVAGWKQWRLEKLEGHHRDQGNYWDNLGASKPPPEPEALAPTGAAKTAPIEGVLYRVETYHAFFKGCAYYAAAAEEECQE